MRAMIGLLLTLNLSAAITNVRVRGTTPSQAVLSYTAPDGAACTLEVYDTTGMKGGGLNVTAATNAAPIEITTQYDHYLTTGDRVYISGVSGNTNANGYWTVTVTGVRSFQLNGSAGSGAYLSGGTVAILVHDLNTRLFAGAEQDTRAGNVVGGRDRVFVIGKRAAEKAADNRWYSRALQVDTEHRYRLARGSDVVEGMFRTANIALGSAIYDVWPADPDAPNGTAWPTIDFGSVSWPGPNTLTTSGTAVSSNAHGLVAGDLIALTSGTLMGTSRRVTAIQDANHFTINAAFSSDQANQTWVKLDPTKTASAQTIIDPQSGVLLRRMSGLRRVPVRTITGGREAWGGWTSPENALVDDAASASYTGTGSGVAPWLAVTSGAVTPNYDVAHNEAGGDGVYNSVGWISIVLKGTASTSGPNGSVDVCLSKDGVGCFTRTVTQDLSVCASGCQIGNSLDPVLKFWEDPAKPTATQIPRSDLYGRTGTATWNAAAKRLTINSSQQAFNLNWKPGSRITVDGVSRVIASVDSQYQLTLESGPAADGSYPYAASNFSVLVRKTTNSADTVRVQWVSFYLGTGTAENILYTGADRCSPVKATQTYNGVSRDGYVCMAWNSGDNNIHWVDPVTGDTTYLTETYFPGGSDQGKTWSAFACSFLGSPAATLDDPRKMYCSVPLQGGGYGVVEVTYTGSMLEQAYEYPLWGQVTERLVNAGGKPTDQLIQDFLTAQGYSGAPLKTNQGNCVIRSQYSHYVSLACYLSIQDTLGWMAMMDLNTGQIVSAVASHGSPPFRYCQVHGNSLLPSYAENKVYEHPNLKGSSSGGASCGAGPWQTEITSGLPLPPAGNVTCPAKQPWEESTGANPRTCTEITVSGDVYDPNPCSDSTIETPARGDASGIPWLGVRPGDIFSEPSQNYQDEFFQVLAVNGNKWTVLRGVYGSTIQALAPNAVVYGHCGVGKYALSINTAAMVAWDPEANPLAQDISKIYWIESSHYVSKFDRRINEGYKITEGTPPDQAAQYAARAYRTITSDPPFAGKLGNPGSDTHPSMGQYDSGLPFALDQSPLYANPRRGNFAITAISTGLYAMNPGLNRKHFPTMAFCGRRPLVDVSGPGSKITNATGDNYKYCVIDKDAETECTDENGNPYAGAAVGKVLFNCPYLTSTTSGCGSQMDGTNDSITACIADANSRLDTAYQLGIGAVGGGNDDTGRWSRTLSRMLGYPHRQSMYANLVALPDASWALGYTMLAGGTENIALGVKLPPYPLDDGPQSNGTFVASAVHVTAPPPGTDNVVVEFGYDPEFRCGSRREACVSTTGGAMEQPVNEALPFYWASEAYAGTPCASGCTVTIPALPQRVLYYRVKYRKADGTVLKTGRTEIQTTS
jgi:hypothetical protein